MVIMWIIFLIVNGIAAFLPSIISLILMLAMFVLSSSVSLALYASIWKQLKNNVE